MGVRQAPEINFKFEGGSDHFWECHRSQAQWCFWSRCWKKTLSFWWVPIQKDSLHLPMGPGRAARELARAARELGRPKDPEETKYNISGVVRGWQRLWRRQAEASRGEQRQAEASGASRGSRREPEGAGGRVAVLLYCCITVILYYHMTVLLHYRNTVFLYYRTTVLPILPHYRITALLYYCCNVLPYYCIAAFPY